MEEKNTVLKYKKLIFVAAAVIVAAAAIMYKPEIHAEKINIRESGILLGENMSKDVSLTVEPKEANDIEYVSDDLFVAKFENGIVEAKGEGETYIYIKSGDKTSNKVKVKVDFSLYKEFTDSSDFVYSTKSGKKYHRRDCKRINPSIVEYTQEQAQSRGLGPCKECIKNN